MRYVLTAAFSLALSQCKEQIIPWSLEAEKKYRFSRKAFIRKARKKKPVPLVFTALASICVSECAVLCSLAVLSSEESDSWRQCLHSRTDSSTAECVWNCVCVCVGERVPCLLPSPSLYASLFPPLLRYSSPLSGSSPLFLPPLHFLSTISSHSLCVSLLPLPPPPPSLFRDPLLSLSQAVHQSYRWMSLRLWRLCPWLAAIHKLLIKTGRRKKKKRDGGGVWGCDRPYIPVRISSVRTRGG